MKLVKTSNTSTLLVRTLLGCLTILQFQTVSAQNRGAKVQRTAPPASKQGAQLNQYKKISTNRSNPAANSSATRANLQAIQPQDNQEARLNSETQLNAGDFATGESDLSPQPTNRSMQPRKRPQQTKALSNLDQRPGALFFAKDGEFIADFGYGYTQGNRSGTQRLTVSTVAPSSWKERYDQNLAIMRFGYGISSELSLGIALDYESGRERRTSDLNLGLGQTNARRDQDTQIDGMGDPQIFGNYRLKTTNLSTLLGIKGSFAPGKAETSIDGSSQKANRSRGGNTLGFMAALFNHSAETAILGAEASYLVQFDRAITDRGTIGVERNSTVTGGNIMAVAAFVELPRAAGLGLKLGYDRIDKSTARQEYDSRAETSISALTEQSLTGYLTIKTFDNFQILPAIKYSVISGDNKNAESIDRNTSLGGSLIGRLAF